MFYQSQTRDLVANININVYGYKGCLNRVLSHTLVLLVAIIFSTSIAFFNGEQTPHIITHFHSQPVLRIQRDGVFIDTNVFFKLFNPAWFVSKKFEFQYHVELNNEKGNQTVILNSPYVRTKVLISPLNQAISQSLLEASLLFEKNDSFCNLIETCQNGNVSGSINVQLFEQIDQHLIVEESIPFESTCKIADIEVSSNCHLTNEEETNLQLNPVI